MHKVCFKPFGFTLLPGVLERYLRQSSSYKFILSLDTFVTGQPTMIPLLMSRLHSFLFVRYRISRDMR